MKNYIKIVFSKHNELFNINNISEYKIIRWENELAFEFKIRDFAYLEISFYMNMVPTLSDDPDENLYFDKRVLEILSKFSSFNYIDISFIAYNSDPTKGNEHGSGLDIKQNFAPVYEAVLPFFELSDFVLLSNKHSSLQIVVPGFLSDSLDEPFREKIIVREIPSPHLGRFHQDTVRALNSDPRLKGEVIYVDELGPFEDFLFESEDTNGNIPSTRQKTKEESADERAIADYIFADRAYKVTEYPPSPSDRINTEFTTYQALDTA